MKLYELKKGDKFTHEGTVYTFHGMDGMYAKVTWKGMHDDYALLGNPMMEVEVLDDTK